jgi:tRNA (guanine-N7-)-methyltransferase
LNSPSPIEHVPEDYFHPLDPARLFPTPAPLDVDLGSGEGSFLLAMAQAHPERNYIGAERLIGRIRNTCRKVQRAGLTNVRLLRIESAYFITHLLPAASASRIYILFPDPWPKRRHWPRRLIQPRFLDAVALTLEPDGGLWIKTDEENYFAHIRKAAAECASLTPGPWPEDLPLTDFERHYVAQGRPIYSICLTRR